jgi:hypothetical protein
MFDMEFLTVSCLVFIMVVSGFVGSNFLAFRRLMPDLRAFIGTLLYPLLWFGLSAHSTSGVHAGSDDF